MRKRLLASVLAFAVEPGELRPREVDLAAQFDRHVAFVGRGVVENSETAQRLGARYDLRAETVESPPQY